MAADPVRRQMVGSVGLAEPAAWGIQSATPSPMDGGRVFRAALARHRCNLDATLLARLIARFIGEALVAVGFLCDVWVWLVPVGVSMPSVEPGRGSRWVADR